MKAITWPPEFGAWWKWVGGIGLLLIAVTVLHPYMPDFNYKDRLIYPFHLGREQNVAAWWSGMVLFMSGILFYEFYCRAVDRLRLPWLLLSVLMVVLSADEISSFHERLDGWRNKILVGLPFGLMFVYAVSRLFTRPQTHRTARFILFGFLCFASIGIQEFLQNAVLWPDWARGIRVGVEEGTELVGSFLVLCAIADRRSDLGIAGHRRSFGAILPVPGRLRHLSTILLAGVLLHLGIGVFAEANFDDLARRGNPESWYPAAVFLVLSIVSFGKELEASTKSRLFWRTAAAVFLMSSLSAVFFRISIPAGIIGIPRPWLLDFYFVYGSVTAMAAVVLLAGPRRSARHLLLLAAMVTVVAVELLLAGSTMPHFALGVFAYLAWHFFVLEPAPVVTPGPYISTA